MRFLVLVAVLSGCGEIPYVFKSRCGALVSGPVNFPHRIKEVTEDGEDGWTEEKYNTAEEVAIKYLAKVKDERFKNACAAMDGVNVRILDTRVWDFHGTTVSGLTSCGPLGNPQIVYIGNSLPHESALAHEMAHAVEGCMASGQRDLSVNEDESHAGWHAKGIYNATSWYYSDLYNQGL